MKKNLSMLLVLTMALTMLAGCGGGSDSDKESNAGNDSYISGDVTLDPDVENDYIEDNGTGDVQDSPTCVVVGVPSSSDAEETREDVFSDDVRVVNSHTLEEMSKYLKAYNVTISNWQEYLSFEVEYDENMNYHVYLSAKDGYCLKGDGFNMEISYLEKEIKYAYWDETLEQVQSSWESSSFVQVYPGESRVSIMDHEGSEANDFVRIENFVCKSLDPASIQVYKLEVPEEFWTDYNGRKVLLVREGNDTEYAVVYEYENNAYELQELMNTISLY